MRRQPSLRSQLNQIRLWVRQGRTDAWIAHKLDIGVDELSRFKREHQLDEDETTRLAPADPLSVEAPAPSAEQPEDDDSEDEDDRPARRPRESSRRRSGSRPPRRREPRSDRDEEPRESRPPRASSRADVDDEDEGNDEGVDGGEPRRRRRRGRRGGRRHRARRNAFEATFDHGDEGYGLWLDPAVVDNPVYTEHWAGHRAVTVVVEADAITIRRAGADRPGNGDEGEEPEDE